MRNHYTPEQHRAASILDDVKAGLYVPRYEVKWALVTLGEPAE